MKSVCLLTASIYIIFARPCAARADFVVDSWVMSANCINPFGSPAAFYTQVQNPFVPPPLVASVHNSMATAAYSFNWGLATGQFHFDADLASEGGDGGPFCASDNQIEFHITQDKLLSFDGELSYQFSGGIRRAVIRLSVRDLVTNQLVFIRGDSADTAAGDPPTDTMHVTDSIVLNPGSYRMRAFMELSAVGGNSNSVSTAQGFADINFTTVPEPVTLLPLAFATVFIRKPWRRR